MADFYGEAGKNPFTLTGIGGILSTVTNAGNGVTQIYRQGALTTQQSLGTYNPSTGKFTPNQNAGLTDAEIKALSSENAISNIKNKSNEVVKKGLVSEGSDPQAAEIKANQITSPNSGNELGDPQQALQQELNSEATKNLSRSSFPKLLKYPDNLKTETQDVIKFSMLKYEPRKFNESGDNLGSFGERSDFTKRTIGDVCLPIPGGISDTNSVNWGSDTLSAAQKALADFANTVITRGASEGSNTAQRQIEQVQQNAGQINQALGSYFTEQAVGVTNLLSRTQGAIQNPNMELLFSGPSLRPFSFTFKLSARGKADVEQIRKIIRFFKQGMAVQRTASNLFLKAPHTFKIQYLYRKKDHPYINYIKECALQSFTVNYTPEGNYMTFADNGSMVSYEISMQFQELEPIFNDDYSKLPGGNSDTVIGY